jgi:predicted nuclease of predicted toxin-antitoxin system
MNFLLDVHLPIALSKFLNSQNHCTAIHVNQILQKWHTSDSDICRHADENSMVVVTKDTDFKNSHFINKTPKRVIRITLGNISNTDLMALVNRYLPFILPLANRDSFYIELSRDQITIID